MTTVRIKIDKTEDEPEIAWRDMSFMEKWRNRMKRDKTHTDIFKTFIRILFIFQTTTQLYVFLVYIIPRLFDDEWTRYWLKVLTVFLCIEWVMNYFCTLLYSTDVKKTRDNPAIVLKERWENPPEFYESYHQNNPLLNGHLTIPVDDGNMPWKFCEVCEIHIPPRAHHCDVCKQCILKRDHHCYFVGTCIGFKNQRYFFVWAFYSILVGALGLYFTVQYLKVFYWPTAYSWTSWFPPVACYRWLLGTEEISFHIVILIIHVYLEFICAFLGMVYFSGQTALVFQGLTMFEFAKQVKVKCKNGINHNFRSVFGDFWALNFVFPMTILLRQREDGFKWEGVKIDYNSNYKET